MNIATDASKSVIIPFLKNLAPKIVLIYTDGLSGREHTAILGALNKLSGVKPISISQQDLELGRKFKRTQSETGSRLNTFWEKFVDSSDGYDGVYPELFSNKLLQFQFEKIKDEMEAAANYGDVFSTLLELLKPSLVIFGHEAFTIERVLVRLARNRNIATAGLLHGGLGHKFHFRGIVGETDMVVVWNETDIEYLVAYGVNKSRLKKIGCVRYESNYIKYNHGYGIDSSKAKNTAKERLGVSQGKPVIVLVTAEINIGLAVPLAEPSKHREAIRGVISLAESRPDLHFVIKPHPSFDYYELYRRLADPKRPNLTILENGKLDEILDASDICMMINYCTSAAIEAMLHRVPVVYLNNAVYPRSDWQDNLSETGIQRVATLAELELYIDSLLTNPKVKELALSEADKQIKDILDIEEFPASKRFIDLLTHILDDEQISNKEGLQNVQKMHDLLYLYDGQAGLINKYFNELGTKHSGEYLMYAFVHLAGANNFGLSSISKIFDIFHEVAVNDKLKNWNTALWILMPIYISAYFKNQEYCGTNLAGYKLLIPYIAHPYKITTVPVSFWKFVGKSLVKQTVGYKTRD